MTFTLLQKLKYNPEYFLEGLAIILTAIGSILTVLSQTYYGLGLLIDAVIVSIYVLIIRYRKEMNNIVASRF